MHNVSVWRGSVTSHSVLRHELSDIMQKPKRMEVRARSNVGVQKYWAAVGHLCRWKLYN